MAHVSAMNYTRMAEAAANDLVSQDIPLNDSISKMAASADLNHEQVHRLCEATNNVAFNKMFKDRDKTADDRIVDFPVASASVILGNAVKTASLLQEEPSALDMRELRELPEPVEPVVKTAAFELRPEVPVRPEVDARTLSKALDLARHNKIAAVQDYQGTLASINQAFKRVYNDLPYPEFAKTALALHPESSAILQELKAAYGLEAGSLGTIKTAGVIDDSHSTFTLLKEAAQRYTSLRDLHLTITKMEQL